jgi:hypothetical protein
MATIRSLRANRARKSNNQPSHIDDWMYVKLALLKINVNENRVKNAHSGGFPSVVPVPGVFGPDFSRQSTPANWPSPHRNIH